MTMVNSGLKGLIYMLHIRNNNEKNFMVTGAFYAPIRILDPNVNVEFFHRSTIDRFIYHFENRRWVYSIFGLLVEPPH